MPWMGVGWAGWGTQHLPPRLQFLLSSLVEALTQTASVGVQGDLQIWPFFLLQLLWLFFNTWPSCHQLVQPHPLACWYITWPAWAGRCLRGNGRGSSVKKAGIGMTWVVSCCAPTRPATNTPLTCFPSLLLTLEWMGNSPVHFKLHCPLLQVSPALGPGYEPVAPYWLPLTHPTHPSFRLCYKSLFARRERGCSCYIPSPGTSILESYF